MFTELMERLRDGEEMETLLPEFKKAAKSRKSFTPDEALSRDAENDFEIDDTFQVVEAAKINGEITPQQYEAIRAAVLSK